MAIAAFRHLGLKVVSIALATLLWLLVSGEQIVERALRIPLEFINLPAKLELVGEPPTVVDVRVRGSSGALSQIAAGELVAVLDLRTAKPGQRLFHLTGSEVRAPFDVDVVQVTPATLSIAFEASSSKVLPIVPEVEGEPADGYVVGTVSADPPTVEVIGPVSALQQLTQAITEPVSVASASAPVTELVTVGVVDPSVRLRASLTARVKVNVTPAPVEWAVAGVAVSVSNGKPSTSVVPKSVTVHLRGSRESLRLRAADLDATVDVAGLSPGQYELPVRVAPPDRVGIVRVEPTAVRVRIR